jgi:hypothetical protein
MAGHLCHIYHQHNQNWETVGRDADIAQIVFVHLLVNTPSLCLTSTGIVAVTITRRRCRFHLSVGVYFKEASYFFNAVQLLVIP